MAFLFFFVLMIFNGVPVECESPRCFDTDTHRTLALREVIAGGRGLCFCEGRWIPAFAGMTQGDRDDERGAVYVS